ncbi:hypothetical protein BTO20_01295 [Mycobacterium dioxanotrophicus]|uniref:DUF1365 domain-containing protein n=1 Tax=Mycobacterium dioxanotrophicus TaxID=482462 RepID=A0A1Y0BWX6_9MYCO|nr:DUF1365 domain-containing protein [Mycobacterium dioxanotrophicus]ART67409.1 hypothetical protein BTO20_01295 [Mycobacterium dioxanotrophicus]
MTLPRIVRTRIRHVRRRPIHHEFGYHSYSWLVDLDELPQLPGLLRPFAQFRSADHAGEPQCGLRANIDAYLAEHGISVPGGRVLMLANARVLGFVFNPLTLYWCHDRAGAVACVVAEVHNTYGGRHRYLVRTDPHGNAIVAKDFYVSPFNAVTGNYHLHVPEPDRQLHVAVHLRDPAGSTVFSATMTGAVHAADTATVLRALVAVPLAPLLVALRIRWQGVRLWARGLPVVTRPQERI